MEQVFIAFEREEDRNRIRAILEKSGLPVRGLFRGGAETVRGVRRMGGGVVVCASRLSGMTARELSDNLSGVARVAAVAPASALEADPGDGLVLIPASFTRDELVSAVQALCQEAEPAGRPAPRSDEDRALIARAKALLMERRGMTEPDAHRHLQRQSMLLRVPLAQAARRVLDEPN